MLYFVGDRTKFLDGKCETRKINKDHCDTKKKIKRIK